MTLPPALHQGDRVAVIAPSSPVERSDIAGGVRYLESLGFKVVIGASIGQRDRFLAGSDASRAAELAEVFADDTIRGVFVARGGYGSPRVLDQVDWKLLKASPKLLVGFSDTTALQLGLLSQCGVASVSAMVLKTDCASGTVDPVLDASLKEAVFYRRFQTVTGLRTLNGEGEAAGRLVGGCLSLVTSLAGTPYLPEAGGAILFFEDLGEAPYRVDRLLTQLRLSGYVQGAAAVIFGAFEDCVGDEEDGTVEEVLTDFAGRVDCPVLSGLPYGHGQARIAMPIGVPASLRGARLLVGDRGGN